MKKKILIICNYFSPDNAVAAIRITKFAKYLKKSGYEVEVISEQKDDLVQDGILIMDAEGVNICRIQNTQMISKIIAFYKRAIAGIKNKRYNNLDDRFRLNKLSGNFEFYPFETAYPFIGSMDYMMELLRQFDLFLQAKKRLINKKDFDYCITSYGDYFGLLAGLYIHRKYPRIKWIFDIRDPICRYKFTPKYVWPIAKRLEKIACTRADAVTAVTKHMRNYCKKYYNSNTYCITNGFDAEDRGENQCQKIQEDKLCFVYTGAMYGGLQDLSVVFTCVKELLDEGKIDKKKIGFHFAGRESAYQIFARQAEKCEMLEYCTNVGRLPREKSLQLQSGADLLLAPVWDFKSGKVGNITGKILEYMSAQKPVIVIVNGDVDNNEVADVVRRCGLGIVYEQIRHKKDKELLKQFILEKYVEWLMNGNLQSRQVLSEIEKFDYRILARHMIQVLETEE